MDLICPQCNIIIKDSTSRLVQDSCGHKKCRVCLLNDEHECKLCVAETENEADNLNDTDPDTNGAYLNDIDTQTVAQIEQDHFTRLQNVPFETVFEVGEPDIKPSIKQDQACLEDLDPNTNIGKRPYTTCLLPNHITVDENCKYTCSICSRSFISKGYIKYHKYCANGGKRPYQCKTCPKSFINLSQLEVHELIHSNKKPFTCDICKKTFRQRSKLTRHRLLHNDKKLHKCDDCEKAFKTKESLTSHIATHTTDKPFSCSTCNSSFNNSSNYRKHLVIHTKEKPYVCDQCGKSFKLKWTLNIHKKIHSSIKPYKCNHCTKVFSYAKDLQRHELIHIDSKAYACGSCSVEFRRKDNLERHIRNLHPGKTIPTIKKKISSKKPPNIPNAVQNPTEKILPSEVPFINFQNKLNVNNQQPINNNHPETTQIQDNTSLLQRLDVVRDRPNAVTVIRAPPGIILKAREYKEEREKEKADGKLAINAPLKLALKTTEFKSHYNIQSRSYVEPELEKPPLQIENKIKEHRAPLTSYITPTTSGLHYETSFEQEKHAIIKNIKFKLPAKYTNLKSKSINVLSPMQINAASETVEQTKSFLNNISGDSNLQESASPLTQSKTQIAEVEKASDFTGLMNSTAYVDLGRRFAQVTAATSVIVNTSETTEILHWRRKTGQSFHEEIIN